MTNAAPNAAAAVNSPPIVQRCAVWALSCVALALTLTFPARAFAAAAPQQASPVRRAQQLRDARQFAEAVRVLDAHLASNPDDVTAVRLLAQTLYWLHDVQRATAVYQQAIARHPADVLLRLEYGRMLLDTRQSIRLREVLAPLLASADPQPAAHVLLGTDAYWDGDLTAARRHLRDAIAAGSTDADAVRQLHDIQAATAPWIRVAPAIWHDDQPLDRIGVDVEAGWFPTPLVSIAGRVAPDRYETGEDVTTSVWTMEGRVSGYVPDARLELEAAGGIVRRTAADVATREWTGRAALDVRAGHGVRIGGRVARAAYFNTAASLTTPVTYTLAAGGVRLDTKGWLGEAEYQHQQYFDENAVRTAYGWLLAPLVRKAKIDVQAGYAAGRSDSDELRFVPDTGTVPIAGEIPGRYDPYHTPIKQTSQSIAGALRVTGSNGAVVRLSGSVAIDADEDVPSVELVGGQLRASLVRQDFSPWTLRGSAEFHPSARWTISVIGETGRTSFYEWTTVGVHLTHRFVRPFGPSPRP